MLASEEENLLTFAIRHYADCTDVVLLLFIDSLGVQTFDKLVVYPILKLFILEVFVVDFFKRFIIHAVDR